MLENVWGAIIFTFLRTRIFSKSAYFWWFTLLKTAKFSRAYGAISPCKCSKNFSAPSARFIVRFPSTNQQKPTRKCPNFRPPSAALGCHYSHQFSESRIFAGVSLVLRIFAQMLPKKSGCQYKRGGSLFSILWYSIPTQWETERTTLKWISSSKSMIFGFWLCYIRKLHCKSDGYRSVGIRKITI